MAKSKHPPKTQARWSYLTSLGLGLGILALASTQVRAIWPALPPQTGRMVVSQLPQQQQPRTALIIANYAYGGNDDLTGPRQDATAMYNKLKSLGFDVPPPVTNATKQQMEQAMREFVQRMRPGGVNVFYYSGHGVQIKGDSYLLPVGLAKASSEIDVEYNAVRLDYFANYMYSVVSDFNFLIIDACRNTPFYRRWNRPKGSGSQGLAFIAPPANTMIAYAAQPGEIAEDGDDNSPFTASLLKYLGRPGMTIYQMLHQIRDDVLASTKQEQRPAWEGSPPRADFGLPGAPIAITPTPAPTPPPARPTPTPSPTLISAVTGVNYQPLRDALVAKDYRLANETTRNLMLRAAGRESEGWFREEDLKKFSCPDLKLIDQLWLAHSNGKFGFSVQQQIYKSLGGTLGQYDEAIYGRFGDQVGWRKNNNWLWYDEMDWRVEAPRGHLPFGNYFNGYPLLDILRFWWVSFLPVDSCRV